MAPFLLPLSTLPQADRTLTSPPSGSNSQVQLLLLQLFAFVFIYVF